MATSPRGAGNAVPCAHAGGLLAQAIAAGAGSGVALAVRHTCPVAAVSRGHAYSRRGSVGIDRHSAILAAGSMEGRVVLSDTWAVLQPLILKSAIWLVPLLAVAWAILSGLGRSLVLRRYDPSLPSAPFSSSRCRCCGCWPWAGLRGVVLRHPSGGELDLEWIGRAQPAALLVTVICLTLGLFTLWSLASWVLFIAPLLVLLERRSALSSLWRSFRLGRTFQGKLTEVNLVLGIVKLALLVLAMVLSATPLPFESVMTGEALHQWWIAVTILYFVANDFFQVARLISFIQFWSSFAEGEMRRGVLAGRASSQRGFARARRVIHRQHSHLDQN